MLHVAQMSIQIQDQRVVMKQAPEIATQKAPNTFFKNDKIVDSCHPNSMSVKIVLEQSLAVMDSHCNYKIFSGVNA